MSISSPPVPVNSTRAGDLDLIVEIERLAVLDPLDYEAARAASAKRLGFRAHVLDKAVANKRRKGGRAQAAGQTRSGNAATCGQCGRPLTPKRSSHRQRFCSPACKKAANRQRGREGRTALYFEKTIGAQGRVRPTQNPQNNSTACKGALAGRGSGICGPRRVIDAEIGRRGWIDIISTDGVRSFMRSIRKGISARDAAP